MKNFIHTLVLGASLTACLIAFGTTSALAAEGNHDRGRSTVSNTTNSAPHDQRAAQGQRQQVQQNRDEQQARGVQRGQPGVRQGAPVFEHRPPVVEHRPDGDRGRGGDWGRDHRPVEPVFHPGHDRDHPFRGRYLPPAGFGGRDEWIDARGIHHAGHFYCSPGWRPTTFFFYPSLGYWIDPVTGVIVYSAPAGLAPYTVVVDETVYEEVWDPILGQWVTVPETVTYYYTATWYPAVGLYGYSNYAGVVIYIR